MLTKNDIIKLKKDADETINNLDMSKYNKDMFMLAGSAIAIKNNILEESEVNIKVKKNGFDDYFKEAINAIKEALSLYEIAEKSAYTHEDLDKLKTFDGYLELILQKKRGF